MTTGGLFDIYRFQSFTFNVVVAVALLVSGFTGLAEFTIPAGLLALLGLSQVAYVGGKAVTPKVADLDQALTKAREAEESFKKAVSDKRSAGVKIADLNNAKACCPGEYKVCQEAIGCAGDLFVPFSATRSPQPSPSRISHDLMGGRSAHPASPT